VEDVAQQLLLLQWNMLKQIDLKEFDDLAWTKRESATRSPNICKFIDHFNKLVFWIITRIVTMSGISSSSASTSPADEASEYSLRQQRRAKQIKKFIALGKRSLELRNFNVVMAVVAGLSHCAVSRLREALDAVSSKSRAQFAEMDALMDSRQNYKSYRQALTRELRRDRGGVAIIPYLGIYLRDLIFIDDGNPTFVAVDVKEDAVEEPPKEEVVKAGKGDDKEKAASPTSPTPECSPPTPRGMNSVAVDKGKAQLSIRSKRQRTMLINCNKVELMGSIYEDLSYVQSLACSVKPNPDLQAYFSDIQALTDEQLYQLSKREKRPVPAL